ncbi:MAG: serine/threonine protein kinase [Deltaproteobacteria bacterium]|nr:MAG: serine/threonine protein kinase [Deltaproteobacteria bacterium]
MLPTGKVLKNRYKVLEVIGGGGMGAVYRAEDLQEKGRIVALKSVKSKLARSEEGSQILEQFKTEARILAKLNHPNLPRVTDYFSDSSHNYLVMEYVEGDTLERHLEKQGPKPFPEIKVLNWAVQLCRVLYFLSIQKPKPVVFRDLKPSNIMVTPHGRIKLIDFGIARFFKEEQEQDTYIFGTPGYAAPEQYGTGQTDVRSDIFSLGATLHHCLTGADPNLNPFEFKSPREINERISGKTSDVIMKALENDQEKRYQSAAKMKSDIYQALVAAAKTSEPKTKRLRLGSDINKISRGKKRSFELCLPTLGCACLKGSISFSEPWVRAVPDKFDEETVIVKVDVDPKKLKGGRFYQVKAKIKTDQGTLKPLIRFKVERSSLLWGLLLLLTAIAFWLYLRGPAQLRILWQKLSNFILGSLSGHSF